MWLSQGRNHNPRVWRSRALITFLALRICCKNGGSESSPWRQVRDISRRHACHHPFRPSSSMGDNASRRGTLKEDGRYPDMAVEQRMQLSTGRKLRPLAFGVAITRCGEGRAEWRNNHQSLLLTRHTTHSSLNPNVIAFTTFASSINQQEHSGGGERIQEGWTASEGPEEKKSAHQ